MAPVYASAIPSPMAQRANSTRSWIASWSIRWVVWFVIVFAEKCRVNTGDVHLKLVGLPSSFVVVEPHRMIATPSSHGSALVLSTTSIDSCPIAGAPAFVFPDLRT